MSDPNVPSPKVVYESKTIVGLLGAVASIVTLLTGYDLSPWLGGAGAAVSLGLILYARLKDGSKLALTPTGLERLLQAAAEALGEGKKLGLALAVGLGLLLAAPAWAWNPFAATPEKEALEALPAGVISEAKDLAEVVTRAIAGAQGYRLAAKDAPAPAPPAPPSLLDEFKAVAKSLLWNTLYLLASLTWTLAGLFVIDRVGVLRAVNFAEELQKGNLAAGVVLAGLILAVFHLTATTFR